METPHHWGPSPVLKIGPRNEECGSADECTLSGLGDMASEGIKRYAMGPLIGLTHACGACGQGCNTGRMLLAFLNPPFPTL